MRIVIFLNSSRGIAVLKAILAASDVQVSAVVTPPTFMKSSLSFLPREQNIQHREIKDVNAEDSLVQLKTFSPEVFLIAGYSTIFKAPLLAIPSFGTLNLHAGRLPDYRGGSPLNWQIINGESKAGISVIRVEEGIDTGSVLAEADIDIGPRDTILNLHERANELFPELAVTAIAKLKSKDSVGRVQTENTAQYWHQRSDADGHLNFRYMRAVEADKMIRAITKPYPGAYAYCEGHKVRLFAADLPQMCVKGMPSRVCFIQGKGPYIVCADRAILITNYEFENMPNLRLRHGQYLS